jgi:hypothetical protein
MGGEIVRGLCAHFREIEVTPLADYACEHCGALFQPRVGGKPQRYCRAACRRRAAHERAALRRVSTMEPFDGSDLEPWTGDDDG